MRRSGVRLLLPAPYENKDPRFKPWVFCFAGDVGAAGCCCEVFCVEHFKKCLPTLIGRRIVLLSRDEIRIEKCWQLAQLVEHRILIPRVTGSSPVLPARDIKHLGQI